VRCMLILVQQLEQQWQVSRLRVHVVCNHSRPPVGIRYCARVIVVVH
jgi:hypothetical protein